MSSKKNLQSIAEHLPVFKQYAKQHLLENHISNQNEYIANLNSTIKALEARNEMWADEVRTLRGEASSLQVILPVAEEDIFKATFKKERATTALINTKPPYTINWVVPPMGPVSGGHASIFRFVRFLISKGHICRIYFYDPLQQYTRDQIRSNLKNYPEMDVSISYDTANMEQCDAVFATSWHTAYPVETFKTKAKKFYFVQDFEPYFDPVGSYSTLAENTYKFGFHGITLGGWLSEKLQAAYGMHCDALELGVNLKDYNLKNSGIRKKIMFYARPVTPRRGFELGVLTLKDFHEKHPDFEINFVGWDITPYQIPFPYINNKILSEASLNELYNKCAAGLVLSFTNMSLLPLEMIAAGCVPVVNDANHTRQVPYASLVKYADPTPSCMSEALYQAILNVNQPSRIKKLAEQASSYQWGQSFEKFEEILLRELS